MNKLEIYELEEKIFDNFIVLFEDYNEEKFSEERLNKFRKDIFNSNGFIKVFLATYNDEYIGFMLLVKSYSTNYLKYYYDLQDFFIIEKYRSSGFGTKLFDYLITFSKENGYPRVTWITNKENLKAQKFYSKYSVDDTRLFYKMEIK